MTFVLGLTGSIGMGKSTTSKLFAEAGVPVWDADATAHKLYAPGGAAALVLGTAISDALDHTGAVDRAALRSAISNDPKVLDQINAIVHPLVAADRASFLAVHKGLVLLDVPLLYETGLESQCDRVAVVTIDPEIQEDRVLARGTMTESEFNTILSRQMPDAEKRQKADYVIVTDTLDHAREQVGKILEDVKRVMSDA